MIKECRHCQQTKDRAGFPANRQTKDGLSPWCRSCHGEATRRWREAQPNYSWRARARAKQEEEA